MRLTHLTIKNIGGLAEFYAEIPAVALISGKNGVGKSGNKREGMGNMIDINEISVLNDIRERLAAVTPEQIEAAGRKLASETKKQDQGKLIGQVRSDSTRALYTLSRLLQNEHRLNHAKADCADNELISEDLNQQAALLDMLADVVREIFWAQAKIDLGFHEESSIGIRKDWELFRQKERNPHEVIQGIIGGMRDE